MSLNSEAEVLRRVPLFSKLDPATLKLLAYTSDYLSYTEGELLFNVGDLADSAYVILEGQVEVLVPNRDGVPTTIMRGKNDIIGEMGILNEVPRNATVRAKGTVDALRITGEAFINLLQQNAVVALEVARQLSLRLAEANAHQEALRAAMAQAGLPASAND